MNCAFFQDLKKIAFSSQNTFLEKRIFEMWLLLLIKKHTKGPPLVCFSCIVQKLSTKGANLTGSSERKLKKNWNETCFLWDMFDMKHESFEHLLACWEEICLKLQPPTRHLTHSRWEQKCPPLVHVRVKIVIAKKSAPLSSAEGGGEGGGLAAPLYTPHDECTTSIFYKQQLISNVGYNRSKIKQLPSNSVA